MVILCEIYIFVSESRDHIICTFMPASYMKHFAKFFPILHHHNASFSHFCFIKCHFVLSYLSEIALMNACHFRYNFISRSTLLQINAFMIHGFANVYLKINKTIVL